jgi:hypothetical protein
MRSSGQSGSATKRRLRVRYDRSGIIQDAWTALAASVVCFRLSHENGSVAT